MIDEAGAEEESHSEQEENYFVSMTDMMVGILFVFIILLMVFALNFRTQTDVSKEKIQRLQEAAQEAQITANRLQELQTRVSNEINAVEESERARSRMLEEIRKRLADAGLDVQVDETNGVLRLTENAIRFPVDSADLTQPAAANVDKVAAVLSDVLPTYTPAAKTGGATIETMFIEGHTDVTGSDDRNWQLSTERAVSTFRRLTQAQPSLRALRNAAGDEILSVSGYSSTRGVPNQLATNYEVQRRIDLRFVMDVDNSEHLRQMLQLTGDMQDRLKSLQRTVEKANAQ
jgi:outer membrane protein OmpA-like peptidoglycan-associated protein